MNQQGIISPQINTLTICFIDLDIINVESTRKHTVPDDKKVIIGVTDLDIINAESTRKPTTPEQKHTY